MKHPILLLAIAIAVLPSCVGKKKFLTEVSQRQDCEKKAEKLSQDLRYTQARLAQADTTLRETTSQLRKVENEKGQLSTELKYKEQQIERITDERLSQKQRFEAALETKAKELEDREKLIGNLQKAIDQRDEKLQGILSKIQGALQQYAAEDLTLDIKDGRLYVALSDKLLFESGSAKVDKRGREALGGLANILSKYPELDIVVEGHTDNVPIKSSTYSDNWDLSVIRATSVVRILTKDFNLSPNQVTASGRGEFQPKSSNETKEGRSLNRRTEIVIAPRLDEIYSILQPK